MANQANEQVMDLVKQAQILVLSTFAPEEARDSKVLLLLTLLEQELED